MVQSAYPAIYTTMLIDARCYYCHKFLCQISSDLIGVVRLVCSRCGKSNDISLATVIKQGSPDKIESPATVSTSA